MSQVPVLVGGHLTYHTASMTRIPFLREALGVVHSPLRRLKGALAGLVPFEIIGNVESVDTYYMHFSGLPGAVMVPIADLLNCSSTLHINEAPHNAAFDAFECVAAAVAVSSTSNCALLPELLFRLAEGTTQQRGLESLIREGSLVPTPLSNTFGYHCGTALQSFRKVFDINRSSTSHFCSGRVGHNDKVLCARGTAVCVGVAHDDHDDCSPLLDKGVLQDPRW